MTSLRAVKTMTSEFMCGTRNRNWKWERCIGHRGRIHVFWVFFLNPLDYKSDSYEDFDVPLISDVDLESVPKFQCFKMQKGLIDLDLYAIRQSSSFSRKCCLIVRSLNKCLHILGAIRSLYKIAYGAKSVEMPVNDSSVRWWIRGVSAFYIDLKFNLLLHC